MTKKLIVLDLDGTALKADQTISDRTKKALENARANGHEVMIATGRPYRMSHMYYYELALDTPIVNFNGAVFHHPRDIKFSDAYHQAIDLKTAHELLDFSTNYALDNIAAEVQDSVFLRERNASVPDMFQQGKDNVFIGDLRNTMTTDPTSLLFFASHDMLQEISNHMDTRLSNIVTYRNWGAEWPAMEMTKFGVHKAIGVQAASRVLGIDRKDIIAFGDEDNDLEMLDYAGVGVAMGNAIEPLKNVANTVTLTNEEDGIAVYLEENLGV
ncbi:Cof-type HAD-IIB family hydrolase [Listeria grandensis]|uniref:Cof-type HAD-IIB family hydrolase n=1 Tax=Listeria grandensis TaxID=1494963 RepID=UPI00164E9C4D|nr:Cof-type HAD-IIB family hydrolase [Listeria grandensis]MBC6316856.1 HAD family phosphatase [Listeria grandensis]